VNSKFIVSQVTNFLLHKYPANKCFIILNSIRGNNTMGMHRTWSPVFVVVVCGFKDFSLAQEKSREFWMNRYMVYECQFSIIFLSGMKLYTVAFHLVQICMSLCTCTEDQENKSCSKILYYNRKPCTILVSVCISKKFACWQIIIPAASAAMKQDIKFYPCTYILHLVSAQWIKYPLSKSGPWWLNELSSWIT
jgi:hypothetical protein